MLLSSDLKRKERNARYERTEKAKARRRRYAASAKGQARNKRYEVSHPERTERWSTGMRSYGKRSTGS